MDTVTFLLPDPARVLAGVRLVQDVRIPGDRLDFGYSGDHWELAIDRPAVNRMEYLFELFRPDGSREIVLDPANQEQAAGAFGAKSVREFTGYEPPAWLTAPAEAGDTHDLNRAAPQLDATISVRVWSPPGAPDDEPLPLLVAHDGPEYDSLASLTRYLAAGVSGTWLPRMGASLGALAMLHAHCRFPDAFDALFLESGSFFVPRFDGHERRFPFYRRIVSFVSGVRRGRLPGRPIPAVLTCGVIVENVENNRLMAATLLAHGYPASLHEVPDVHNYTAWRDAFDPCLTPARLAGGPVNREVAELWSDAIGAAGTVIRYGHWGRPVLVFPSEQGNAFDFENNGMVGAVSGLIDSGRMKVYCVGSYDASSWSNERRPRGTRQAAR